ncbi:MAG: type IV pilus modification protein PilV [Dechloromonas sp.]|nr:type IV pilus modification protein PilV [Dechloromonas sp.]
MPRTITLQTPHRQRGTSMLEVLVAFIILAVGLLGLAGLQANALKNNQSSLQRSQAIMLSYSILDAIRADRANANSYAMSATCSVPSGSSLVKSTQNIWIANLKTALGNNASTCGSIACNAGTCTITITWDDSRGGGSSTETLVTEGRI